MDGETLFKTGNIIINGMHRRPILADVTYVPNKTRKPVIVFSHGFKGFKDWGHFNLIASGFAKNGFVFLKYNFSHNGTTPQAPDEFTDMEAFASNNFSIELDDLGSVLDWIEAGNISHLEADTENIFLIGHSRGGGISLLKANEDKRVKKVITWATPSTFENRFTPEEMMTWKNTGVIYVENFRTNQKMPMYHQLVENYIENKSRVDIPAAVRNLKIPCLFVHGTADDVVDIKEVELLKEWNPSAEILFIENGDHTFGATHPYYSHNFPDDFLKVFKNTCDFLKKQE